MDEDDFKKELQNIKAELEIKIQIIEDECKKHQQDQEKFNIRLLLKQLVCLAADIAKNFLGVDPDTYPEKN